MIMRVLLLLIPALLAAAPPFFETGAVQKTNGAAFHTNAYPQGSRLASGKLLVVWSAHQRDGKDNRVVAATSTDQGRTWSRPVTLVDHPGEWDGDPNIIVDGKSVFVYTTNSAMDLKVIDVSRTFMVSSEDDAQTWSKPTEIRMPRKYIAGKQHNGLRLEDGTLVMGISWDIWAEKGTPARTEGEMNLVTSVLRSKDGVNWKPFGYLHALLPKVSPFSTGGVCEPSIVELDSGEIFMILRTGTGNHYESRSRDGGLTWSDPKPSSLMGHNTPSALWRLDQNRKEIIAIWNNSPINRYPLTAAISGDGGRTWSKPREVAAGEGGQVSYPSITQASDGAFVAFWQHQLKEGRDIRWARFNREWVQEGK